MQSVESNQLSSNRSGRRLDSASWSGLPLSGTGSWPLWRSGSNLFLLVAKLMDAPRNSAAPLIDRAGREVMVEKAIELVLHQKDTLNPVCLVMSLCPRARRSVPGLSRASPGSVPLPCRFYQTSPIGLDRLTCKNDMLPKIHTTASFHPDFPVGFTSSEKSIPARRSAHPSSIVDTTESENRRLARFSKGSKTLQAGGVGQFDRLVDKPLPFDDLGTAGRGSKVLPREGVSARMNPCLARGPSRSSDRRAAGGYGSPSVGMRDRL